MQEILKFFKAISGQDLGLLISGFLGGAVYVLLTKNLSRAQMFTSIFVGLCTAYYLTPLVVSGITTVFSIKFDPRMENGIAFILGITSLYVIPAIIRKINKVGV